jgi:purine-nucleoside phosphorylase
VTRTDTALAAADVVGHHDIAVVLGSGWAGAADAFGPAEHSWEMPDLAGFLAPGVVGHAGTVRSVVATGGQRVLIFLGRTHLYEGHGPRAVVHGVRVAAAAGCRTLVLTNAAGALNASYAVGQPVLIADHLNLTGTTPLAGADFVDLTDCWSPRLRSIALGVDATLPIGVYAGLPGPQYETPAEIRMLRAFGADLVGMSTVLEAIAARAAGLDVLGVSLVTNLAAGVNPTALDHRDVLAAGNASAPRLGALLAAVVAQL